MDITGKVVVITGASMGIGRAAALCFAEAGATVVLAARSADKLDALAKEIRGKRREALPVVTDMRDAAAVGRMIDEAFVRFDRIDVLINNAGQAAAGTVDSVSLENFRRIVELNVYGPVCAIQAVAPKMRQAGGGVIVNVSSMVSKMKLPGLGAYAATKAALNMLSDTARVELARDKIRVVTVFPRMTSTDFGKNSLGDQRMRQEQRAHAPANPNIVVDSAGHVAKKILEAVRGDVEEQYMDQ